MLAPLGFFLLTVECVCMQEAHALDRRWAHKLHAAEEAAAESAAGLRRGLESRLEALAERVAKEEGRQARTRGAALCVAQPVMESSTCGGATTCVTLPRQAGRQACPIVLLPPPSPLLDVQPRWSAR